MNPWSADVNYGETHNSNICYIVVHCLWSQCFTVGGGGGGGGRIVDSTNKIFMWKKEFYPPSVKH